MYVETDGIVLKKTNLTNGRNMLTIFSQKYGKISAGSNITEKNRSKSSMAVRPFSYSRFEMYKNAASFNIINGQLKESYYSIGEDIDKYIEAAYVLEYTEKILQENAVSQGIYSLLLEYLQMLVKRKGKYSTLTIGYQIKTLKYLGVTPLFDTCAECGCKEDLNFFSVEAGGMLCEKCARNILSKVENNKKAYKDNELLIFNANFDIIRVVTYILENPLKALSKITLQDKIETDLRKALRAYLKAHLDIEKLKSESFCFID